VPTPACEAMRDARLGHRHVLGIQPGATENVAAVEDLLNQSVARGAKPDVKRLFVIDGAKAWRAAIHRVFGSQHPVQRCRYHKIRNVVAPLPEGQKDQVNAALRASYRLEAKEGMARLRKLADWLEQDTWRSRQFAGGAGGMLHHQPIGSATLAAPPLGHDQSD
jgi:transposase-like protein